MGIQLNLHILPERIDPACWAAVYDETLRVLRACPLDLMGLRREHVRSLLRMVRTRRLEHLDHDGAWWLVVGEFGSRATAEDFRLYRDLSTYAGSPSHRREEPPAPRRSILVESLDEGGGAAEVWRNKTQGLPYAAAVLAAGMLIEHRFPDAALVGGDLSLAEVRRAREFLLVALGESVPSPILTRRRALKRRLRALLPPERVDAAVNELFLRDRGPLVELLLFGPPSAAPGEIARARSRTDLQAELQVELLVLAVKAMEFQELEDDPEALRLAVVDGCHGPGEGIRAALTEDAWEWIDRERDAPLLRLATGLARMPTGLEGLAAKRDALLENRPLLLEIARLMPPPGPLLDSTQTQEEIDRDFEARLRTVARNLAATLRGGPDPDVEQRLAAAEGANGVALLLVSLCGRR